MAKNIALITGVTGQDGSYLSEFLLAKGYEVHGIKKWSNEIAKECLLKTPRIPYFWISHAGWFDYFMISQ